MMAGILGKKIGMTNIFDENGVFVPVTLIEAGPCSVTAVRTKGKQGYSAVQLTYGKKFVKEIKLAADGAYKLGDKLEADVFKNGEFVDVTGTTIGKGFQGGVKRWHWRGGEAGHGSMHHRAPGSIGASSYPSRVFKGQHLPGHMGAVKRTLQNLEVVSIEKEKNLLIVRGAVPGHKGSLLIIKHAKKKPSK